MKIHFHRVKTTQLLRLPCTHLPKPLGHAEKGRQRKNRTREEREKGMKVIHESGEALDECGIVFGCDDTVYVYVDTGV